VNKTDLTPFDKNYKRFIDAGTPWQEIFEGVISGELPKKPLGVPISSEEVTEEWLNGLPALVKAPKFKIRPFRELVTPYVKKLEDPTYPHLNGVRAVNGHSYWTDAYVLFKVNDGVEEDFIHPDAVDSRTPDYEGIIPTYDMLPEYPDLADWYVKAFVAHEVNRLLYEPSVFLRYNGIPLSAPVVLKALKIALGLHPDWGLTHWEANRAVRFDSEGDMMLIIPCVLQGDVKIIEL